MVVAGAGLTGRDLFPRFSDAEFARRHRLIGEAGSVHMTQDTCGKKFLPTSPTACK